jgi:hypothetical protein
MGRRRAAVRALNSVSRLLGYVFNFFIFFFFLIFFFLFLTFFYYYYFIFHRTYNYLLCRLTTVAGSGPLDQGGRHLLGKQVRIPPPRS